MKRHRTPDGRLPMQADAAELHTTLTLAEKENENLMDANTRLSFELNKIRRENDSLKKKIGKLEKKLAAAELEVEVKIAGSGEENTDED